MAKIDTPNAPLIEIYKPYRSVLSAKNAKVILVGGCFDILHHGHIQFLKSAKSEGDFLIVALEPDQRIADYKKRYPTHTQQERAQNLAAIRYIDKILLLPVLNGFKDYNQLVKDVEANVIAVTSNDPQLENKQKQARNANADLKIVINRIGDFSSSKIHKIYFTK